MDKKYRQIKIRKKEFLFSIDKSEIHIFAYEKMVF